MALRSIVAFAAVLALVISCASSQVTQCNCADGSPQLRFVAQLSVSGCALFVHDTGANDGPHLAVEPVMCVTESLHKVLPRHDPITQQTYVSVPVMLRDDAMLEKAKDQLRHLSPKSVKFATVSDISVSTDSGSKFQAIEFVWSPEESVGFLSLGCKSDAKNCSVCNISSRLRASKFESLDHVMLSANISSEGSDLLLNNRLMIQNQSFLDSNIHFGKFACLPRCRQLRYIRSIRLINCTARVHQRLDMKGHFLIEPLLCHNVTSMNKESVMYDYSRDMYYMKLDVVLQDDITVEAVKAQLADLSPRSVAFMRLWRAQSVVTSALSRRFVIGPLMVSADWRSAQLRVYCMNEHLCNRSAVIAEPVDLWKHVRWSVTSLLSDRCLFESESTKRSWRMQVGGGTQSYPGCDAASGTAAKPKLTASYCPGKMCLVKPDGRIFVVIQQRLTGTVSFQRTWTEYERGFGDETDFWIGLSTIHYLSMDGATLRVEAKLWNWTELHVEYAGFKVGDASTNYTMTYREILWDRSSVKYMYDAMTAHKGRQFSTMDRDNGDSSANDGGEKCGWWFPAIHSNIHFNPNGISGNSGTYGMVWLLRNSYLPLREVRLMLQI